MLRINFFGGFAIKRNEQEIKGLESKKTRALFAYLVHERERAHSRSYLASMFWPDVTDQKALHNLRQAISNIRKSIGKLPKEVPILLAEGDSIQIDPRVEIFSDTQELNELYLKVKHHPHRNASRCVHCRASLDRMASLYNGEFLKGFLIADSDEFTDWAVLSTESYRLKSIEVLSSLVDTNRAAGSLQAAIEMGTRLLHIDPWNENAVQALMQCHAELGEKNRAINVFMDFQTRLANELALTPLPETVELADAITNGSLQGESISRSRDNGFECIGREKELAEMGEMLSIFENRLVTIFGIGGTGKTTLAREIITRLAYTFKDGAYFISLENIPDNEGMILSIANQLGLVIEDLEKTLSRIVAFLKEREVLLVLDNFELLLSKKSVETILNIYRACDRVWLLITSRAALNLKAETLFRLDGLSIEPGAHEMSLASDLFTKQATQQVPDLTLSGKDLETVEKICQALEGHPLAIALAASTVGFVDLQSILNNVTQSSQWLTNEMDDLPPRQQNLKHSFEYSWELLDDELKHSLARLSAFTQGFDLSAANQISGAAITHLRKLWLRSFIQMTEPDWYTYHPLVKEYAHEKLASDPKELEDAQIRLIEYYSTLCVELEEQLKGERIKQGITRYQHHLENAKNALELSLDAEDLNAVDTIAESLFWFFEISGRLFEAEKVMENTIAHLTTLEGNGAQKEQLLLKLQARLGWCVFKHGDLDRAISIFENISNSPDGTLEPDELLFVLARLENLYYERGDQQLFFETKERAENLLKQMPESWNSILWKNHTGTALALLGVFEEAEEMLDTAFNTSSARDHHWITSSLMSNLAMLSYLQKEYQKARSLWEEHLLFLEKIGDTHNGPSITCNNLAECCIELGQLEEAKDYLNQALYHFSICGNEVFMPYVYSTMGRIDIDQGQLDKAHRHILAGARIALDQNMEIVLTSLLLDLARSFAQTATIDQVARIIKSLPEASMQTSENKDKLERIIEQITKKAGQEAWDILLDKAPTLDLPELIHSFETSIEP